MAQNEKVTRVLLSQLVTEDGLNIRQDYADVKGLASSILQNGLKTALRGYKTTDKNEDGKVIYVVTDGHRRLKAMNSVAAKLPEDFDVAIFEEVKGYDDTERVYDMLVTGEGSQKLNMLEQGDGYSRLLEAGAKKAEIARRVGKTQQHVDDCIRLFTDATPAIKKQINNGTLSASAALEVIKSEGAAAAEEIVDKAAKEVKPGKKVTEKAITKSAGKAVTAKGKAKEEIKKKASSAGTSTREAVAPAKGKGKEDTTPAEALRVTKLLEALEEQEGTKDKAAFKTLRNIEKWLNGKITTPDLVPMFFLLEDEA